MNSVVNNFINNHYSITTVQFCDKKFETVYQ